MGKRCRFVQPEVVRLFLVDVHKRALEKLRSEPPPQWSTTFGQDVDVTIFGEAEKLDAYRVKLAEAEAAVKHAEDDGEWIDVKAELNAGETRHIFTDLVKDLQAGEKAKLDPTQVGLTKMTQYIVDWSLTDPRGARVPFSPSALTNLDTETYNEISAAVDWHDEDVERRRAERKNARTTANTSATI